MPDIAMCRNDLCKDKETCYRYMATPSEWQSYLVHDLKKSKDECKLYWKMESEKPTKP